MSTGRWTDNWQAIKNTMLLGNVKSGMNTLVNLNGTTKADSSPGNLLLVSSPFGAYSSSDGGFGTGIVFGSGTAAPAAGDWALESRIPYGRLAQLSVVNDPLVYDTALGTAQKTVYVTVQCQYASGVTVSEWGITVYCNADYSGSGNSFRYLVYRGLLDTPVTLQQYDTAKLALTLTLTLDEPI